MAFEPDEFHLSGLATVLGGVSVLFLGLSGLFLGWGVSGVFFDALGVRGFSYDPTVLLIVGNVFLSLGLLIGGYLKYDYWVRKNW